MAAMLLRKKFSQPEAVGYIILAFQASKWKSWIRVADKDCRRIP
jgi:hypothetical protein